MDSVSNILPDQTPSQILQTFYKVRLNTFLFISISFLLNGCSVLHHKSTPDYPDEIDIYSIGLSKRYLVGIRCGEVEKHSDCKENIVFVKDSIRKILSMINNPANYSLDTTRTDSNVEVRIEFDYRRNGAIFNRICFSPPLQFNQLDAKGRTIVQRGHIGWLIKSGNVYRLRSGGKIDSLLNSYKLIRP